MHTRPSAEGLRRIATDEYFRRFSRLSFTPDRAAKTKTEAEQKWCEGMGGDCSRQGAILYAAGEIVPGAQGLWLKSISLFGKAAGLIFQNPNSGLHCEGTSARRARHNLTAEPSVFDSPRINSHQPK